MRDRRFPGRESAINLDDAGHSEGHQLDATVHAIVAEEFSAPAVPGVPTTFVELMQRITPLLSAKVITQEQVLIACQTNGIETMMNLTTRADLIPPVWATLIAMAPGAA